MRPNHVKSSIYALLGALALNLLVVTHAYADIIILSSGAPGLKSGQILKDNSRLKIPAGKSVQLILPSGATKTLKGPFDGNLSKISKGEKSDAGLFKRLVDVVKNNRKDDSGFAAVRRVGRPSAMRPPEFSWTSIPAETTGTFCFAEGEQLILLRPRNLTQNKMTLRHTASDKSVTVSWGEGQKTALWPDRLHPTDKSSYGFLLTDRTERTVNFRMVERAMLGGDDILRTLHRRGCQKQLVTWLRQRLNQ